MSTFLRSALSAVVALTICSCSSFALQIGSGVIPTGVPETGAQLDVVVEGRVSIDNPGPGTINAPSFPAQQHADASTVSVTTLQAPKNALRSYENARAAFAKTQLDSAERELKKATNVYPQFALAWTLLGRVHDQEARLDQARADYVQALSADSRLVRPYRRLAEMAFEHKDWQDVVQLTNELIRLHSAQVPVAYLYNAAANFNMGNLDAAESSGRHFELLDIKHQRPQAYLLLGDILKQKGEYQEAAQQMKLFLTIVPNDAFAEPIRNEADRLQQLPRATLRTSHSKAESQ